MFNSFEFLIDFSVVVPKLMKKFLFISILDLNGNFTTGFYKNL